MSKHPSMCVLAHTWAMNSTGMSLWKHGAKGASIASRSKINFKAFCVGFHKSFVEIHSYDSLVMSDSNLESNLQRFINL